MQTGHGWRWTVGVVLVVLSGCSGPIEPNQKIVDDYWTDADLAFRVKKRYGTVSSDDQLVSHLASMAEEATDPEVRRKILDVQSRIPFVATRQICKIESRSTDEDNLFLIRNGSVDKVYDLHSGDLNKRMFGEFVDRAFR